MNKTAEENPIFFENPKEFRAWLKKHHKTETELWVGYHRKETGRPTMTWSDSVDEALCYGWIDGIRKTHGDRSYKMRFTPRKKTSVWSNVNLAKMKVLIAEKRMTPAGLAIFESRDLTKTSIYSFERENPKLDPAFEKRFRKDRKAWAFFESQAPYYRRLAIFRVSSAKREETREKRFSELLACSAKGERLPGFVSAPKK